MRYLEHRAEAGERWDTIAFDYYGDATRIEELIAANIAVLGTPIPLVFMVATTIRVPVLDQATVPEAQLPIWKRT